MADMRLTVIVACVLVLDRKTVDFLKRQGGLKHTLWVLEPATVKECGVEIDEKNILEPEDVANAVRIWKLFKDVRVVERYMFKFLRQQRLHIIMPDSLISRAVAEVHFCGHEVIFVPIESE